ncbi:MAG: acyl-CoA dehydrogenase family protein [Alphaproteobacteria bacterium]|jgi:alkylation response protein AidB-like acyl-CoA dehydrogenase|nr:acyl-CoA dehydrogenase family protein [Alphaproteobacteria bacterium]
MESGTAGKPDGGAEIGQLLGRVGALAPVIGAAAGDAEQARRLPAALVSALHDAGLYRLLLPKTFGGAEIGPPDFFQVIEAVAKHDASTAWCLCQANGCAMAAAYLEPAVAEEIWGRNPEAVVAWGPGKAEAVADGDHYRVTGHWSFASGGHQATWFGGHSVLVESDGSPRLGTDGATMIRTMLFPATAASVTQVWDVIGLCGTGSDDFAVTDLPVPRECSLAREDPAERRLDAPLYQFPAMSLYAAGFSGTALGIARAMLEGFKELAAEKTPRLTRHRLSDDALVQADVALAEARLGAARAFLISELRDIWAGVVASGRLSVAQRMRIRLAATHAIHEAKAVADSAYEGAGATAIFAGRAFERRFRDIHTVVQQLQGRKSHFRAVGAYLLGHPPDMTVI